MHINFSFSKIIFAREEDVFSLYLFSKEGVTDVGLREKLTLLTLYLVVTVVFTAGSGCNSFFRFFSVALSFSFVLSLQCG